MWSVITFYLQVYDKLTDRAIYFNSLLFLSLNLCKWLRLEFSRKYFTAANRLINWNSCKIKFFFVDIYLISSFFRNIHCVYYTCYHCFLFWITLPRCWHLVRIHLLFRNNKWMILGQKTRFGFCLSFLFLSATVQKCFPYEKHLFKMHAEVSKPHLCIGHLFLTGITFCYKHSAIKTWAK